MNRVANITTVELDRMTDDGGPPPAAASPAGFLNDWYRHLGASHRQRDATASHEARTLQDRDRERERALRRRWPSIKAATRSLSRCYNEGAGIEVLTVVDDANDESGNLIVKILARGGQTLTMTLVGAELCVRTIPGTEGAPDDGRRWITFGSSDEATAAYAIQHWLTQL